MKNFDDFVKFVNSDSFQKTLINVPLDVDDKEYDLTNINDILELEHSFNECYLNQFMQILQAYHNWINEN